jgi:hypothetical protein
MAGPQRAVGIGRTGEVDVPKGQVTRIELPRLVDAAVDAVPTQH